VSAELLARRAAARAALADYLNSSPDLDMMGRALWAARLATELGSVLDELDRVDTEGTADDDN
jgi:hypothetical protein